MALPERAPNDEPPAPRSFAPFAARPRFLTSLMAKAIGLLGLVLVLMSATVGRYVSHRLVAGFLRELDKRGGSLLETLERHQELHAALAARDGKAAEQLLQSTLAGNDDLAYLAALEPDGQLLASAARRGDAVGTVLAELPHHGLAAREDARAESDGVMRRFTQPVLLSSSGPAAPGGLLLPGEAPPKAQRLLGTLVMGIRADRASRAVALQSLPVVVTAATLVLTFFAFFLVLQRRVLRMVRFAEQLAMGDLAARLEDRSNDELGRLATALRDLRASTLEMVAQMHEAADSLASSSTEVLDAAEQQLHRANRQAGTVGQTGGAVMGLRQMSQQATSKAEAVVDLARLSEASSSSGDFAVQQSAGAMRALREQVEQVSETLENLVQQTHQIGSIIAVVTDLAQQSNMVALNANIEAVRAGEAGKGFALVAKEVRSLSDLSRRSTDQVRTILDEIAKAANDTTRVVQEGRRRAESGVELAHAAGKAIRQLAEAIAQSSSAATEIAGSIRKQSLGVEQIGQAISEIDRDARDATRGISLLRHASQDIKTHSDRMQGLVQRYRLPGDPERG